jgi:arylsulfatase A-like enzyme
MQLHLIALISLLGCTALAAPPNRPNVLFLLSDDQRPDTIAALGNPYIQTPNLDQLVRRGVAFPRAVCANPICTPSRAEILSGCTGFRSGVLDFGGRIDPELILWPQAMRAAGYRTWYVGKWHNDGRPVQRGFHRTRGLFTAGGARWWHDQVDWRGHPITGYRGWIFQDDAGNKFPDRGVGLTPDISTRFADAAIDLIRKAGEEPFFLQVCFTAPHDPLLVPKGYEERYPTKDIPLPANYMNQHPFDHGNLTGRDEQLLPMPRSPELIRKTIGMYYRVITHMDEQIGRILVALDEAGMAQNTIVIFSSDHGLGVGSHGIVGKQNMYEHTINVPLILSGPAISPGRRPPSQVYLRDLYPTVCDLTGISIPATVEGKSFYQALSGSTDPVHPYVFCYFRDQQRMVRDDRWKLIYYPHLKRYQLFDLINDPNELRDLAGDAQFADVQSEMLSKLRRSQQEFGDPTAVQ